MLPTYTFTPSFLGTVQILNSATHLEIPGNGEILEITNGSPDTVVYVAFGDFNTTASNQSMILTPFTSKLIRRTYSAGSNTPAFTFVAAWAESNTTARLGVAVGDGGI